MFTINPARGGNQNYFLRANTTGLHWVHALLDNPTDDDIAELYTCGEIVDHVPQVDYTLRHIKHRALQKASSVAYSKIC